MLPAIGGRPTYFYDLGTIEKVEPGSTVQQKRAPAEYGVARRLGAVAARVLRAVFNYAPTSTAPYQLRLGWSRRGVTYYGWLPVSEEDYRLARVSTEYRGCHPAKDRLRWRPWKRIGRKT